MKTINNIKNNKPHLEKIATNIRKHIIRMSYKAKSAHMGGSLSCVEILVSLYFSIMQIDPKNPVWDKRDRLVFSKAHDAKALYATLCERGYFNKDILDGYEKNDGLLAGHTIRGSVAGVEVSAGSLGHGLSIATGMAYAGKLDKKTHHVFAILSDGECNEGSVWEAILFAGQHKLSNLIAIVDYNKLQGYGFTKDILDLEPFSNKLIAFGWNAIEVDGHDFSQIISAVKNAKKSKKPTCIIAHTIKGKGGPKKYVNKISSQYIPATEEDYNKLFKKI